MHLLGAGKAAWLRSPRDGCVCALGRDGTKLLTQTAQDARTTLSTTSHAARFDDFGDADELISAVNKVARYQKPAFLPQDLSGAPAKRRNS